MESGARDQPTLAEYLAPLRARRWLILAIVAVATVAAYAYSARQEKVYEASTKLFVAQEANPLVGAGAGYSDDRSVENQATLLTSTDVSTVVDRQLKYDGSPSELASRVTATPSSGSDFITIEARGRTGEEAAAIANGFARTFIDVRSDERRDQINKALEQLREQLRSLGDEPEDSADRAEITASIRQLEVAARSAPGRATQIDPARPPGGATSPKPRRTALLAFVLSLLGAIFLAYALHRFDPRLRKVDEAATIYRRPVMASLIHDEALARFDGDLRAIAPASREAFRELRVNLDLAALDRPFRTIVVTSAVAGEGKSTVARNLALAYHEAGRRVALVDADLRQQGLSRRIGEGTNGGFIDVLAGRHGLDEAIRTLEVEDPGAAALAAISADAAGPTGNGNGPSGVTFLAAGPEPPNPPAILESSAAASLLQELAGRHDVLIVDTAPLLAVSDAIPLLGRADAVLLVARSGKIDRRGAQRAAGLLERVPNVNVVGVVVNDLTGMEASAYGGYGYGQSDDGGAPAGTSAALGAHS